MTAGAAAAVGAVSHGHGSYSFLPERVEKQATVAVRSHSNGSQKDTKTARKERRVVQTDEPPWTAGNGVSLIETWSLRAKCRYRSRNAKPDRSDRRRCSSGVAQTLEPGVGVTDPPDDVTADTEIMGGVFSVWRTTQ